MQLKKLWIILFLFTAGPVLLISTSHNLYFIIMSAAFLLPSIGSICLLFVKTGSEELQSEEEEQEEFEDAAGISMEHLEKGTDFIRNMMAILFFVYCSFYVKVFFLRVLLALTLAHRVWNMICMHEKGNRKFMHVPEGFADLLVFVSSAASAIVIVYVAYIKFFARLT